MGFTSAFDSLILNKDLIFVRNFGKIKLAFLKNWVISKWALIGITVTHIQGFAYLYVIGGLLGSVAMAEVSASRLLLMPLGLIINGWGNVIRPYGAKLREDGKLKLFFANMIKISFIFPIIVSIMVAFLYLFEDFIIINFLDSSYKNVFEYLIFWAISSIVGFTRANASYGLQVIKKFKSLALINIITMFVTVLASFLLTDLFQIKGAIIANLIGEIVFSIILWRSLFTGIFRE
jgi:O-antigen/teichoic acid export membrane protein